MRRERSGCVQCAARTVRVLRAPAPVRPRRLHAPLPTTTGRGAGLPARYVTFTPYIYVQLYKPKSQPKPISVGYTLRRRKLGDIVVL